MRFITKINKNINKNGCNLNEITKINENHETIYNNLHLVRKFPSR